VVARARGFPKAQRRVAVLQRAGDLAQVQAGIGAIVMGLAIGGVQPQRFVEERERGRTVAPTDEHRAERVPEALGQGMFLEG
jgi:hypothetical protein